VLVELPELELGALAPALLLEALLLELLLPHALTARARTPTAANVPDHALTFIRSSTFATCRRAARYGTHDWHARAAGVGTLKGPALTFDKISTTSPGKAQGARSLSVRPNTALTLTFDQRYGSVAGPWPSAS
jgi:hypothetical protein